MDKGTDLEENEYLFTDIQLRGGNALQTSFQYPDQLF
jgi:hypothetical protein